MDASIQASTVVPVSDAQLTTIAELRHACRERGHPLQNRSHASDLWIAASALHIGARLLTADAIFENAPGLVLQR